MVLTKSSFQITGIETVSLNSFKLKQLTSDLSLTATLKTKKPPAILKEAFLFVFYSIKKYSFEFSSEYPTLLRGIPGRYQLNSEPPDKSELQLSGRGRQNAYR